MESLVSFSKWLSKWFTVAVILWAAFNYALPVTSSWVIPNTGRDLTGRREKKNNETGDKTEDGKFSVLFCRRMSVFIG